MFTIKFNYTTGDSFKTYDKVGILEYSFEKFETAMENLQRIKQYQDFIEENDNFFDKNDKRLRKMPKCCYYEKKYGFVVLLLVMDDDKQVQYNPFWTGYFETLRSAEIILDSRGNSKHIILF